MHTILPEHASVGTPARQRQRQPIQVQSTQLSLDVMILGVCGRQSRKTFLKIHENMEILRNAGNRPNYDNDEVVIIYNNHLQSLLDTVLARRVNEVICNIVDNDNDQFSNIASTTFLRSSVRNMGRRGIGCVYDVIISSSTLFPLHCFNLYLYWIEWRYKHCVGGSSLNCYQM